MLIQAMIDSFWFVQKSFFPKNVSKSSKNSKLHGNFEIVSKLKKISKKLLTKTLKSGKKFLLLFWCIYYHHFETIIKLNVFYSHVVYCTERTPIRCHISILRTSNVNVQKYG
jgi:hypothetical protein